MMMDAKQNEIETLSSLEVTRGDASMLYGLSVGSYTIRFHLIMDRPVEPEKMRRALDRTAERYPYFRVTLKKNEAGYYYEKNDAPVALLCTREAVTLNSEQTNGHIWAVCYDGDSLFIDIYHGRTDGTGAYFLIATLLYYYLKEQGADLDAAGIRTLDTPVSLQEVFDPLLELPLADLSKVRRAPAPPAVSVMKASNLQRADAKGFITRLMIPEKAFIPFSRENDASPGIMICALLARAIRHVHPDLPESVTGGYVINARPMLHAGETFHNCTNRAVLEYSRKVESMPLTKQCTVFRGMTFLQSDEDRVRKAMTLSGSLGKMILDIPDMERRVRTARSMILGVLESTSYTVSYVGKWKFPQLGEHIREFWLETPAGSFPMIELSAVNGQLFVSIMQSYSERIYYNALLEELKAQGIPCTECGTDPIRTADIRM